MRTERRVAWLDPRLVRLGNEIDDGSVVAIHWNEVVDVLDHGQQRWLERLTRSQIEIANDLGVPVL